MARENNHIMLALVYLLESFKEQSWFCETAPDTHIPGIPGLLNHKEKFLF
jgi:hypothetical protein